MELITVLMQPENIIMGIINAVLYYGFFYYGLHAIKSKVNLHVAAIILTILFSLIIATCPIIDIIVEGALKCASA